MSSIVIIHAGMSEESSTTSSPVSPIPSRIRPRRSGADRDLRRHGGLGCARGRLGWVGQDRPRPRIARGTAALLRRLGTRTDASRIPPKVEGVTKHGHEEGSSDNFLKINPISGSSGIPFESPVPTTVSEADSWPRFTDFDTLLGGARR